MPQEVSQSQAVEWQREDYVISTDRQRLDVEVIHRFLTYDSHWATGIPRKVVEKAVANSLPFGLYTVAWRQIGFARVVTDYAIFAYLEDVFVLPDYRGRGLGKWLVKTVIEHPALRNLRRWLLLTSDAHELYKQAGFLPLAHPEIFMEHYNPSLYTDPVSESPNET